MPETLEAPVEEKTYQVVYKDSNKAIKATLEKLAVEFGVNISCILPTPSCFSLYYNKNCKCADAYEERIVGGVVIRFSCNGNPIDTEVKSKLYGHQMREGEVLSTLGWGLHPIEHIQVIKDPDGRPIAQVQGYEIHVLVNLLGEWEYNTYNGYSKHSWKYSPEVLEKIFRDAMPFVDLAARPRKPPFYEKITQRLKLRYAVASTDEAISQFVEYCEVSNKRMMVDLKHEVEVLQNDAKMYMARYLESQRRSTEKMVLVNALNEGSPQRQEAVRERIERIKEFPEVIGVDCVNGMLVVYTDNIFVEFEDQTYVYGAFKIDIGRTAIAIQNLTLRVEGYVDHPNIQHTNPCWGNIDEAVVELLKEEEYEMLVSLIIQFLHTYQHDHRYAKISDWPLKESE